MRKTYSGPHSKLRPTSLSDYPDTPARYGHDLMSVTEANCLASIFPPLKEEVDMNAMKAKVGTLGLALALTVGTAGYAADPSNPASGARAQLMKGTITGEVMKVQRMP